MKLCLKRFVNNNIRNLFIVFVIMLFVTGKYVKTMIPTIINITSASVELNYENAFDPKNLLLLTNISKTKHSDKENNIEEQLIDQLNSMRKVNVEAQNLYDYKNAYRQNNKYKFEIKPVRVYDLGLYYESSTGISINYIDSPYTETEVTHKYILLDTGKALVLTKVAPDFNIDKHQSYKGVFLPLTSELVTDIRKNLGEGNDLRNVFCYQLDTMTSFSSYEKIDLIYLFALLIIVIVIGIKLIIYKINYRRHPTYKQLNKLYGNPYENEISINTDLSDEAKVVVNKNTYKTENWIITRGIFKTKLSMADK